jgi:uncharacterized protein YndB with AHSA1/START domain
MTSDARAAASTRHSVVREIRISASPEVIWSFLVEEDKVIKWEAVAATLDARPGGEMRLDMHGDRDIALGEFRVIEPFERLSFTWGWDGNDGLPPGSTLVEIVLLPEGDETVVRLEHTELPTEEAAQQHGEGWDYYLERLGIAAPGGDPGADQWADAPAEE